MTNLFDLRPMPRLTAAPDALLNPVATTAQQRLEARERETLAEMRRKRPRAADISDLEYWRFFLLPRTLLNMTFDFLDTVLDNTTLLRVDELKRETRELRRLVKTYNDSREDGLRDVAARMNRSRGAGFVTVAELMQEEENVMEAVLARIGGTMNLQLKRIRKMLLGIDPELTDGERELMEAVMQCMILMAAFNEYFGWMSKEFRHNGWLSHFPLRVLQVLAVGMPLYLGSVYEAGEDRIVSLADRCGHELYNALRKIKPTDEVSPEVEKLILKKTE